MSNHILSSIKCVIAILLTTPPGIERVDRMVIVSENGQHQGFYGIYQKKESLLDTGSPDFPELVPNSGIYARQSSREQPTSYAAYCSAKFPDHEIIQRITSEWDQITRKESFNLNLDKDDEKACSEIIRNSHPSELKVSSLRSHTDCSEGILVSLILSNSIRVVGPYSSFAPVNPTSSITILADKPLSIEKIFLWGYAYRLSRETRSNTSILAWYHGHLHIFGQASSKSKSWLPITKIGEEHKNGKEIYEYFSERIVGFTKFKLEVAKESGNSLVTSPTKIKAIEFPPLSFADPIGHIANTSQRGPKM